MIKYRLYDVVKVRGDIKVNCYYSNSLYSRDMDKLVCKSEEYTIIDVYSNGEHFIYKLDIKGGENFEFTYNMLTPASTCLKIGDNARIRPNIILGETYNGVPFVESMLNQIDYSTIYKVSNILSDVHYNLEGLINFVFTSEMLIKVHKPEINLRRKI